jgi:DNA repair exonuclease SbcCD ATPase subunit
MMMLGTLAFAGCSGDNDEALTEKDVQIVNLQERISIAESEASSAQRQITSLESVQMEFESQSASLQSEKTSLENKKNEMEKEVNKLVAQVVEKERHIAELQKKYDEIEAKFDPYEELSEAEAEQRLHEANLKSETDRLELERIKSEQEAERKAQEEAERVTKEEEARIGYNTGITFDNLARNPDDYKEKKVKFSGRVIQVLDGGDEIQIRFAIDKDYDKVVFCYYPASIVSSRILEDDIITIYGVSKNLYTYESTFGAPITIPMLSIEKIDT